MVKNNSWSGLCKNCSGLIFTAAAKRCTECKVEETNSAWKRCATCAKQKNKCSYCNKPLKKQKYAKRISEATRITKFRLGANDEGWQVGITAASEAFVNQATDAIAQGRVTGRVEIAFLNDAIEQIKSKKVVLFDWLEVDEFLKTGKLPVGH